MVVTTVWIVMGLAVAGGAVAAFTSWRRGGSDTDLGAVSHQWISEHRLGHGDSRR